MYIPLGGGRRPQGTRDSTEHFGEMPKCAPTAAIATNAPPWGRVSFRPPSLSSPSLISLRCERGHHWNPRRPSSGGGFSLRRCLTLSPIILSTSISSSPFNSDEELRLKGGSPEGRTPEQLPGLTSSTQVRPLGSNVSECGTARLAPQSPRAHISDNEGETKGGYNRAGAAWASGVSKATGHPFSAPGFTQRIIYGNEGGDEGGYPRESQKS